MIRAGVNANIADENGLLRLKWDVTQQLAQKQRKKESHTNLPKALNKATISCLVSWNP